MSDTDATEVNQIGDAMPDGTIYAGISPDTHRPMYARPRDELSVFTFDEAARYTKNLNAHGHDDFRVPSEGELNVLFENREKGMLKGTFNETGSGNEGWYWSSSPPFPNSSGWAQCFTNGYQNNLPKRFHESLRCVR